MAKIKFLLGLIAALLIVLVGVDQLVDRNKAIAPYIEAFNQGSTYKISVGKINHSVFSPSIIGLESLTVSLPDNQQIELNNVELSVSLAKLFSGTLFVDEIYAKALTATLSATNVDQLSAKSIDMPKAVTEWVKRWQISSLAVDYANINYRSANKNVIMQGMRLTLFDFKGNTGELDWNALTATANIEVDQLAVDRDTLHNIYFKGVLSQNILDIKQLEFDGFVGHAKLKATVQLADKKVASVHQLNVRNMHFYYIEDEDSAINAFFTAFPLAEINIEQAKFTNVLVNTVVNDKEVSLHKLNGKMDNIPLVKNYQLVELAQLNAGGMLQLQAEQVIVDRIKYQDFKTVIQTRSEGVVISDMEMGLNKGKVKLSGDIYQQQQNITANTSFAWYSLPLETLRKYFPYSEYKVAGRSQGVMSSKLTYHLDDDRELVSNLSGDINVTTTQVGISGVDLDILINALKANQVTGNNQNNYLYSGPLGVIALQASDLGQRMSKADSYTTVKQFSLDAEFKQGLMKVSQAKLQTVQNIIGFKGKVNLNQGLFDNTMLAFLDKQGCAAMMQQVNGIYGDVKDVLLGESTMSRHERTSMIRPLKTNKQCMPFFQTATASLN